MIRNIKNFLHLLSAMLANVWYGFPSRKLFVIGVTGTDGKTTTVHLLYHMLKHAGKKAVMISTTGAFINNKVYDTGFHVTTPSSFTLQAYMKKAVEHSAEYVVLEVTSHALDQYRVWGIPFRIGVLTNVSHEHLDYHETFDRYLATKFRLLRMANVAIINRDDEAYEMISSKLKSRAAGIASGDARQKSKLQLKTQSLITYGVKKSADVNLDNFHFETRLIGEFNRYNILAATAVCREIGIVDQDIRAAIESFEPPTGRQEVVYEGDFTVIVDFAHTPNAFSELIAEIALEKKNRLIHVFGAAGERDSAKRPIMGKISSQYADIIILTAEDPRSESIDDIMTEVEKGIPASFDRLDPELADTTQLRRKTLFKIQDRKAAIEYAISLARKGDIVLCTGKGHETSMNLGQGEIAWNERDVVKQAIEKKKESSQRVFQKV